MPNDIERALLACKSQGLQPNTDWCRYYITQITKKPRPLKRATDISITNTTTGTMTAEPSSNHQRPTKRNRSSVGSTTSTPRCSSSFSGPPLRGSLSANPGGSRSTRLLSGTKSMNPQPHFRGQALTDLSDLNPVIFCNLKCDGIILNGHDTERSETVLQILCKIYDLFFDFLYESQLAIHRQTDHNPTTNGFGGRLCTEMVDSLLSERNIPNKVASKWAAILGIKSLSDCTLSRDQLNMVLRLLSMHQNGVAESMWNRLDAQTSIVPLPSMPMPSGFVSFLENRYPNWSLLRGSYRTPKRGSNRGSNQGSHPTLRGTTTSDSTQHSNQYALGPPDHQRMSLDTIYHHDEPSKDIALNSLVLFFDIPIRYNFRV